jgi:hypothetical protein
LAELDRLMGLRKNRTALARAMQVEFDADPVRFFRSFVMPLLPRESRLAVDREGVIEWRSLVGGDAEEMVEGGRLMVEAGEREECRASGEVSRA